jgi:ATP-binding cassette subfamily C protein
MRSSLQQAWSVLDRGQKRAFKRLFSLSAMNAVLEVAGAGLIFALVGNLQGDGKADDPLSRGLSNLFPDLSARQLSFLLCGLAALFYVVKSMSGVAETVYRNRRLNEGGARLSVEMLRRYLAAPLTYHHTHASSDLIRTSFYSTDLLFRYTINAGSVLVAESMTTLTLLVVLLVAAPLITPLVLITMGGVTVIAYRTFRRKVRAWGEEVQVEYGQSMGLIGEAIRGYRDIRLLEADEHFIDKYGSSRVRLGRGWSLADAASQSSRYLLETVFVLSVVVLVTVLLLVQGDSQGTTALLALYGYAGFRILPSANRALQAVGYITHAAPSVEIVLEERAYLTSLEDSGPTEAAGERPLSLRDGIEFSSVRFSFPGSHNEALRGINLHIGRGESVGIVGPSGAGKSTLVDVLVGLLPPDGGQILVDGQDVTHRQHEWHSMLGYVSQSTFLLDASLLENIAFGVTPDEINSDLAGRAIALAQLEDFVASLPNGVDTNVGENGVRLSGGQRQRIAIARALYRSPQLLVFDEATSALDNATEAELTAAIDSLAGERTLVIIAHRLTTVRSCDRIFLLKDGLVADSGTYDELLNRSAEFRRLSLVNAGETAP